MSNTMMAPAMKNERLISPSAISNVPVLIIVIPTASIPISTIAQMMLHLNIIFLSLVFIEVVFFGLLFFSPSPSHTLEKGESI